jgi:hypothetical protein
VYQGKAWPKKIMTTAVSTAEKTRNAVEPGFFKAFHAAQSSEAMKTARIMDVGIVFP